MFYYGRKNPEFAKIARLTTPLETLTLPVGTYSFGYLFDWNLFDQGQFGSCVPNGADEEGMAFYDKRKGQKIIMSRRANYRKLKEAYENGDFTDDGAQVIDGLQVLKNFGYVLESDWPYPSDGDVTAMFEPVPDNLWRKDLAVKAIISVPTDVASLKLGIFHKGPVVIGFSFAASWEGVGPDGLLPLPDSVAGGHCVVIDDFDDNRFGGTFGIQNSWGPNWGDKGRCYLPYSFARSDPAFWVEEAYALNVA